MENKSGSGYTSPFGDEKGATATAGAASGSHDFVNNPQGSGPTTGGKDFTKDPLPAQKAGSTQEGVDEGSTAKTPWVFSDMDKSGPGIDGINPPVPFKNLKG